MTEKKKILTVGDERQDNEPLSKMTELPIDNRPETNQDYNELYREEYKDQARKLCALGAIDEDIADFFNVSVRTIYNWKNEFPDFAETLREAKLALDSKVVRSLFERATGYSHKDYKFAVHGGKITDVREFEKHYPPETAAIVFWLKNRQPALWRDKHHMELTTSITVERLAEGRERALKRIKPDQ